MPFNKKLNALVLAVATVFAVGSTSAATLSRAPQDNLFYATATDPVSLDPALVDDDDSAKVTSNIYEGLLKFADDNADVKPCLATSYTVSEDGLSYTFKLRQGVKFHDGTPFNAQAVKFNIDRQMPDKATAKMSYAPLVYGEVVSTEVIDDYTIKINLSKNSTPFLHNLAMVFAAPVISPKALQEHNNNVSAAPCGTGPYKFVSWDKGQQVILTVNEDYWGEKPLIKNIIFRTMPETSARVVALNNSEVDVINGLDANVIPEIKANPQNHIYEAEGMNVNYMFYNVNKNKGGVTQNVEVRRAISMAINVPELVQSLYKGYASYANTFLPSFVPGYSKDVKQIAYNPEKAKEIFKKYNVTNLKIITYSGARWYNTVGGQVLAEAVQSYLNKVGVNSEVLVYDWATFKNKTLTDNWDIGFKGWIGDNGDPDNFLALFASDDPISNDGLYFNQEYNDLIAKGLEVQEGPERNAIYAKAEQVLADDAAILPISHAKILAAYKDNVKNFKIHQVGLVMFHLIDKE